jgi:hypothetical protein
MDAMASLFNTSLHYLAIQVRAPMLYRAEMDC